MNVSARLPYSEALLTDLYQLTMAFGYWRNGTADRNSIFSLFFRQNPFQGGFTVAAGLESVVGYLGRFRFSISDLQYLASLKGSDEEPLFDSDFLDYLSGVSFSGDLDAVEEGTIVFPNEPLLRVRGPLLECQLVETALLNLVNFPSLIATKAARVSLAAGDDPVLEFGLRRAQGVDGGLTASRASYLGGCEGTSNVLAGKLLGLPVRGTHAHSWVMTHASEVEAFQAYARALPNNCIFLVDTYSTVAGVRNAVVVAHQLRENGHELIGIRLDSGDLIGLSRRSRQILDESGLRGVRIVASGDLDEHKIAAMKRAGACVDIWGVGTRLVTAFDDPALGGVYKLSSLQAGDGRWEYAVKLSEGLQKTNAPGPVQVRRVFRRNHPVADILFDEDFKPSGRWTIAETGTAIRQDVSGKGTEPVDLLVPVFRRGQLIYTVPTLEESRRKCREALREFPNGVLRLKKPHVYPVCYEKTYWDHRNHAVEKASRVHGEQHSQRPGTAP